MAGSVVATAVQRITGTTVTVLNAVDDVRNSWSSPPGSLAVCETIATRAKLRSTSVLTKRIDGAPAGVEERRSASLLTVG